MNAMDFDDLLVRAVNVLELFQEVRDHYAGGFRHVLVDEYQDTNHAQYRWLQLLAEERRNLMVVGDDAQCLVAGTLVTMADGSRRPIEDVGVGDEVLSGWGGGSFGPARVARVHRSRRGDGVAITLRSGRRLVSTPEHTHFAGRYAAAAVARGAVALARPPPGAKRARTAAWPPTLRHKRLPGAYVPKAGRAGALSARFARWGRASGRGASRGRTPGWPATVARCRSCRRRSCSPGMVMFAEDGGYDVVERVERVALDAPVYDLDIERTHNFIADGIVTHNSIYGFRGADIRNILEFEDTFPDAHVVKLEQNYRSTQTILDAANAVIRNNRGQKPKSLWTELGQGDPIKVRELEDEHAEARYVTGEIQRLLDEGVSRAEIAVFYRTNAQSRVLQDTLVRGRHPLPGDRRHQVLRASRDQGRDRVSDHAGQPAGRRRVHPDRQLATAGDRLDLDVAPAGLLEHDRARRSGTRPPSPSRCRGSGAPRSRRSGGSWPRCTCCASERRPTRRSRSC